MEEENDNKNPKIEFYPSENKLEDSQTRVEGPTLDIDYSNE